MSANVVNVLSLLTVPPLLITKVNAGAERKLPKESLTAKLNVPPLLIFTTRPATEGSPKEEL